MIYELVYTSARRGLKTGSRGFCTVAQTDGMSAAHVQLAESLSGYRNLYQPHDPNYGKNPVALSHYIAALGGEQVSVLSRVAAYGTDYSGRTNKLAHHVMIPVGERPAGGPCDLAMHPAFFLTEWKEEPRALAPGKALPEPAETSFAAEHWQAAHGDAGWAGVLAQAFLDAPDKDSYIVFSPGAELLPLLAEALRLLPPARRWQVTFSTYFNSCPRTSSCLWRCCLSGSDAHRALRSRRDALLIDLTREPGALPAEGELVECARTGSAPAWARVKKPRPSVRRHAAGQVRTAATAEEDPEHEPLAKPVPRKKAVVKRSGKARARRRPIAAPTTGVPVGAILAGVALTVCACAVGGWLLFGRRRPPAPPRMPPPVVKQPAPRETPKPERGPTVDPDRPDTGAETATNMITGMPPKDGDRVTPPPDPDKPEAPRWDSPADAEILVRTKDVRRPSPPWQVTLPSWEDWGESTYTFYGRRGPLALDPPTKDMDRLKGLVRQLLYDLAPLGLRASITPGKVVIDRAAGAGEGGESMLHTMRIAGDGRPDRLVWLRGITIRDGRLRDRTGGPEIRVPLDATLALLCSGMVPGQLTCMVGFSGTELRRPISYRSTTENDELVIALQMDETERERVRTVVAWKRGQEQPAPKPVAPKPARADHLLDHDRLSALLEDVRASAGSVTGIMSPVKRKLVIKDLRTMIVDRCETPLARSKTRHPEAAHIDTRLDALRGVVEDALSGRRRNDDDDVLRIGGDGIANTVRNRATDRAAFFRGTFLPSNRKLTSLAIYDIVHSDELAELVAPPPARPGDDFVAEEEPEPLQPQEIEIIISEVTFHPRGASWESLLSIRFTESDPL
jgi:hypothetical protein